MKKQTFIVEIEMPDGDMVSPGWLQDLIQQDCDNEQNKGRQTVSVRDAQLPSNLDEAAEEYKQGEIDTYTDYYDDTGEPLCFMEALKDAFKAGAEWMAGQGITKEAVIGMATKKIIIGVSEQALNELDLCPGDNIVIQIKKK